jgi:diaminopimelate epimerase
MNVEFHKMHGLGNDFVLIENLDENSLDVDKIKFLANRNLGIGFEQLLLVNQTDQEARNGLAHMTVFESTGGRVNFCGNGVRCAAGFYYTIKKSQPMSKPLTIVTGSRTTICSPGDEENSIRVNIGKTSVYSMKSEVEINLNENGTFHGHPIYDGNKHLIIFVKDFNFDLDKVARLIALGDHGDILSFAQVVERNKVKLQVWERFSACLTLACGSAACATFYTAFKKSLLDDNANVEFTIGSLHLKLDQEENIIMTGPFCHVYSGQIKI